MKASVITREPVGDAERALAIAAVEPIACAVDRTDFWIGKKERIRAASRDRAIGVRLLFGLGHVQEMTAGEKVNFQDAFGFEPVDVIGLKTYSRGDQEERALGSCVLAVAQSLSAVICFCGPLRLPNARSVARSDRPLRVAQESATNRVFGDSPGRIRVIPFEERKGQLQVAHYCDAEFMGAWVKNPYFHMAA